MADTILLLRDSVITETHSLVMIEYYYAILFEGAEGVVIMHPEIRHEQVVYQNPHLAVRIWKIQSGQNCWHHEPVEKIRRSPPWHYHEEVELLLILNGELTVFFGEEQLALHQGDVALFGSSEPHWTLHTGGQLSYIVFQINLHHYWVPSTINCMKHFLEVIRPLSAVNYIFGEHPEARTQIARMIQDIFDEMNAGQIGYELAVTSRIKSILLTLLRYDRKQLLNYTDNRLIGRLQPAIDYVEAHLNERLTIEALSKHLNISYTYFIKLFKKAVGMPFTDFVNYKRIKKAEQQLLTSDISIAEIAESVGISNLGHFYDLFRRYNDCSPKQFKDRLREPYHAYS